MFQAQQSVPSMCVCVWTFELSDPWRICWFILIISRSSSKLTFIGRSSSSQDEQCPCSATDARYVVYILNRQRAALNTHATHDLLFVCRSLCVKVVGTTRMKAFQCLVRSWVIIRRCLTSVLYSVSQKTRPLRSTAHLFKAPDPNCKNAWSLVKIQHCFILNT